MSDRHRLLEFAGSYPPAHQRLTGGLEAGPILVHDIDVGVGRYHPGDKSHYLAGAGESGRQDQVPDQVAALECRWNLEDVLLIRRTGSLAVGEIISLVAVSSLNSEDAFEACRFGINRLKKMSTISKAEKFH